MPASAGRLAAEQQAAAEAQTKAAAQAVASGTVGYVMPDGTVYAGISPDTGKAMYAAPADEPLKMSFNAARQRAEELTETTGKAYRVPSDEELKVLFNNRAAIGGFDLKPVISLWYWSSTRNSVCKNRAADLRFGGSDSYPAAALMSDKDSVRLVRS